MADPLRYLRPMILNITAALPLEFYVFHLSSCILVLFRRFVFRVIRNSQLPAFGIRNWHAHSTFFYALPRYFY
jgi:hypothetical protein